MRHSAVHAADLSTPELLPQATTLAHYLQQLSAEELQKCMHISPPLAAKTRATLRAWSTDPSQQTAAIESFIGDIYSGLQASSFTEADLQYATQHLRILSGLYGVLRPLDGVCPYRLEMGYKLPKPPFADLYAFWHTAVATTLPKEQAIVNLAAIEYSKAVLPYLKDTEVITPKFLTRHPKTQEPTFVVVHAKIARGAFARWMIVNRVDALQQLAQFAELGYNYDSMLSTPTEPMFVCTEFGGKGLSIRLQK